MHGISLSRMLPRVGKVTKCGWRQWWEILQSFLKAFVKLSNVLWFRYCHICLVSLGCHMSNAIGCCVNQSSTSTHCHSDFLFQNGNNQCKKSNQISNHFLGSLISTLIRDMLEINGNSTARMSKAVSRLSPNKADVGLVVEDIGKWIWDWALKVAF